MQTPRYLDFTLTVTSDGNETCSASVSALAGEARLTFDAGALAAIPAVTATPLFSPATAVEVGELLFDTLFTEEIRMLYHESRRMAADRDSKLRVRLRMDHRSLAHLPWELLYDTRTHEHLCLLPDISLVRHLDLPQPAAHRPVKRPLRVLGIGASPDDMSPVDLVAEADALTQHAAVHESHLHVHWLAGSSWQDLERELSSRPWHVLHFVGHGQQIEGGVLFFADATGAAQVLGAVEFARLLSGASELRLVVLNACEGADDGLTPFSGLAQTLVRRGIPSVVAMQRAVTTDAARLFTEKFYTQLALAGSVEDAVATARRSVSLALSDRAEWSTPVLFMRAAESQLLAQADPEEAMVNSAQLAQTVVTVLTPFLVASGQEGATATGDQSWQRASKLMETLKRRVDAGTDTFVQQALDRFAQKPEARQAVMQDALEELFDADSGVCTGRAGPVT